MAYHIVYKKWITTDVLYILQLTPKEECFLIKYFKVGKRKEKFEATIMARVTGAKIEALQNRVGVYNIL